MINSFKLLKSHLLFLLFIIISLSLQARIDSFAIKASQVSWTTIDGNNSSTIDTTLQGFELYNPIFSPFNKYYTYLGNTGLAAMPLIFQPDAKAGFEYGQYNVFNEYLFLQKNIKFYNAYVPYTNLSYTLGTSAGQIIEATHTQNLRPNFNFAIYYRRIVFPGDYNRQSTGYHNFYLSERYLTRNNRYGINGAISFNNGKIQENGGIAIDSIFEHDNLFSNRELIPVKLQNSESIIKRREIMLYQQLHFGPSEDIYINDSTSYQKIIPKFTLSHLFNYKIKENIYSDQDVTPEERYYALPFMDSLLATDSSRVSTISNQLGFAYNNMKDSVIKNIFTLSFLHDYYDISQYYDNQNLPEPIKNIYKIHDASAKASATNYQANDIKNGFSYMASAEYHLIDYNQGNYLLNGEVFYNFKNKLGQLGSKITFNRQSPDFIANRFISNFLQIENSFDAINSNQFSAIYRNPELKLSVSFNRYNYKNYIYWDITNQPVQASFPISVNNVIVQKEFRLGSWGLNNYIVFQDLSQQQIINLPSYVSRHSFYKTGKVFKGNMDYRTGINIYYHNNYHANAYSPITGTFLVQNTGQFTYYPVLDYFLNVRVKRLKAFFLIEHLNKDIFYFGYYGAPNYPMPDRKMRIGLSWSFFD